LVAVVEMLTPFRRGLIFVTVAIFFVISFNMQNYVIAIRYCHVYVYVISLPFTCFLDIPAPAVVAT
jgi:hypothetical protein